MINALTLVLILFQVCWSQQQILYVKNASSSPCPNDSKIISCQTLDWYAVSFNTSFSNKLVLLQEGYHILSFFIQIHNCHNFIIAGNGSAKHNRNGQPQPSTVIDCSGAKLKSGLFFFNSTNITIVNLELRFCSGEYKVKDKYNNSAALIFNSVQDITLNQIVISNAMGYGLHTINIFGNNKVVDSAFLYASKYEKIEDSGNVNFFFDGNATDIEKTLMVNSSWFMYGESRGRYQKAGGLNIDISSPNVHITIVDTVSQGNVGTNGGNLALFLVLYTTNSSSIAINNSCILDGRAQKGGGLRFWLKQTYDSKGNFSKDTHPIFSINNTRFQNNSAKGTGGAIYIAFYDNSTLTDFCGSSRQVVIQNCHFTDNIGNGAAMEIILHSSSQNHMIPLFQTSLNNCSFVNNSKPSNHLHNGPILDFIRVEVSITDCNFTGSNTTVMSLRNTYLNLFGEILFENNIAQNGGALKVCEASLVLVHNGTYVRFINNSAKRGGAIYVQQPCMDTMPVCFIEPIVPKGTPVIEFNKTIKLEFINNSATIAGDVLYGGDLDVCVTMLPYFWNASMNYYNYWYSKEIFKNIFVHHSNNGPSWVSSDPRGVCLCHESKMYNHLCTTSRDSIETYPGEQFAVSVITVGQMNGSTAGMIDASLLNDDHHSHSLITLSHPKPIAKCIDLKFVLQSNQTIAKMSFKPVTPEIDTHYSTIMSNLTVHLLPCPLGFQLTHSPPYTCICSPLLTQFLIPIGISEVACNISNQIISVPKRRVWFGCFKQTQENQSSSCDSFAVTPNCDYYCFDSLNDHDQVVKVSIYDLDTQCLPGHTGIMCGACKSGYSRVFGAKFECEKDCTHRNLPYLLLFFLIFGILLVIIIMVLNLTITEGTLNGFLVYAMVIQTPFTYFPEDLSAFGKFCWVFISWINLSFGIKICFFKGMDGYQQIWFIFAQISYFIFIVALIVLLSRKLVFFTRLFGRNIIKVLATLIILLYSNLVFATFNTFRYATLHIPTSNGSLRFKVAWYYDGNVPYFGLKHALLSITALICTVAMLFFVFSLLLIQCLQKRSHLWCLSWVVRFRPFYEAYTGPCHDNYRFWPGFLLFMRSGLYVINSLIPSYDDVFFRIKMFITAATFVIIMSLACIFPQGVYKRWPLNVLEFSFFLNLCITSGILGFNYNRHHNISAVYTSVCISALTFIGILLYHVYKRVKDTAEYKKLTKLLSTRAKIVH